MGAAGGGADAATVGRSQTLVPVHVLMSQFFKMGTGRTREGVDVVGPAVRRVDVLRPSGGKRRCSRAGGSGRGGGGGAGLFALIQHLQRLFKAEFLYKRERRRTTGEEEAKGR